MRRFLNNIEKGVFHDEFGDILEFVVEEQIFVFGVIFGLLLEFMGGRGFVAEPHGIGGAELINEGHFLLFEGLDFAEESGIVEDIVGDVAEDVLNDVALVVGRFDDLAAFDAALSSMAVTVRSVSLVIRRKRVSLLSLSDTFLMVWSLSSLL
jgi:hypothetical protein